MAALSPARAPFRDVERAIDWPQVRTVLWAQWRLGKKAATRNAWVLALTVLGWAMFAGAVTAGSVVAYFLTAAARQHAEWGPRLPAMFHIAFLLILLMLAVTPALGLRGNEFLDVTKLFIHPVNHRTVFAASLLGLTLSKSVLFFGLPLLAAVAGYGGTPLAVAGGLLVTVLLILVAVALGQTVLLLFLDLFRSRRWRDVSRIFGALIGAGVYGASRFLTGRILREHSERAFRAVDEWKDWTLPIPSWWAAHAITGASSVRWLPALALPVVLYWLVTAAARLQERAYFGEIEERRTTAADSGRGFAGWIGRRSGLLAAVIEKDLRILLRDPTVRILLIQQAAFSVLPMVAIFLQNPSSGARGPLRSEFLIAGMCYVPVLASVGLVMNPLGTETGGMQHVLLTPVPRRTILLGKMLALTIVVGGALALLVAAGSAGVSWFLLRETFAEVLGRGALALVESLSTFAAFTGVCAIAGAYFPSPLSVRGRRALRQTSAGRSGCTRSIVSLLMLGAGALACLPVSLAAHHPMAFRELMQFDSRPFLVATIPLGAAYGAFVLWLGSRIAGKVLASREEATLEVLSRSPE